MLGELRRNPITEPERVSVEVLAADARLADAIAESRARFGPNYILFRHPDTRELVPGDQLGMGIEEWKAQMAARDGAMTHVDA